MSIHGKDEFFEQILAIERESTAILQSKKVNIQKVRNCNLLIKRTNQSLKTLIDTFQDKLNEKKQKSIFNIKKVTKENKKPDTLETEKRLNELVKIQLKIVEIREKIHEHLSGLGIEIL